MPDSTPKVMTWRPTPEARGFGGQPLPADRDFFVLPPPEVGRVVSAASDVRQGQTLWPYAVKVLLTAGCVVASVGLMAWTSHRLPPGTKPDGLQNAEFMLPLCAAVLVALSLVRKRWIGYVGDQGAALYGTRGTREDAKGQVVRFADIADVRIAQRKMQKGWIEWRATFVGHDGTVLLKLRGNVKEFRGRLLTNTVYSVAAAAHKAWEQRAGKAKEEATTDARG